METRRRPRSVKKARPLGQSWDAPHLAPRRDATGRARQAPRHETCCLRTVGHDVGNAFNFLMHRKESWQQERIEMRALSFGHYFKSLARRQRWPINSIVSQCVVNIDNC